MKSLFIDVNHSMSGPELKTIISKIILTHYEGGDTIVIFNNNQADIIKYNEIVEYYLTKDTYLLKKILFKKGVSSKWKGSGVWRALSCINNLQKKICFTKIDLVSSEYAQFDDIFVVEDGACRKYIRKYH